MRIGTLLGLLLCLPAWGQDRLDPTRGEVPLPARPGWRASLILDNDVGVWTVRAVQLLPRFGCPEVIGLDDRGRCTVLVSYSGKWTPRATVEDGAWLGAIAHVDLDPHHPGPELYVGGKKGNLYQIRPNGAGGFDTSVVFRFAGLELHTFAAGDLLPERAGSEMLVMTRSGETILVAADPSTPRGFSTRRAGRLPGRVRDAVVLPVPGGRGDRIVAVSRAQRVMELRVSSDDVQARTILREPMGFGRIARREPVPGRPEVVYVTRDDGLVLRLEEKETGGWARAVVYAGPQGPRGVVAGRFDADPDAETIAVFGYSGKVQLLTRRGTDTWQATTLFEDRDKGHWLAVAELDGRNATLEIVGSGYGRRIFMLARPPGYGLAGVPTDPDSRTDGDQEPGCWWRTTRWLMRWSSGLRSR